MDLETEGFTRRRGREHVGWRAARRDAATGDEPHRAAVAQCEIEIVGHDDRGGAGIAVRAQHLEHAARVSWIEARGLSCIWPVWASPGAPGPEGGAFAEEVRAIESMDSLTELLPGCDEIPVWRKRHHKMDATIASTIVAASTNQNARR